MFIVRGRVVEREKRKGAGGQGVFWMEAALRGGRWRRVGGEGMERGVDRANRVGRRWIASMFGVFFKKEACTG